MIIRAAVRASAVIGAIVALTSAVALPLALAGGLASLAFNLVVEIISAAVKTFTHH